MSERKALHAYVTNGAHDQWHDFAAVQGVSVSAILEAMAPDLPEDDEQLIKTARKIDAQRRRRRR